MSADRIRTENILNDCLEAREKAFEMAVRLGAKGLQGASDIANNHSNMLTGFSGLLDFVLDTEDGRSFHEWLNGREKANTTEDESKLGGVCPDCGHYHAHHGKTGGCWVEGCSCARCS